MRSNYKALKEILNDMIRRNKKLQIIDKKIEYEIERLIKLGKKYGN